MCVCQEYNERVKASPRLYNERGLYGHRSLVNQLLQNLSGILKTVHHIALWPLSLAWMDGTRESAYFKMAGN